MTRRKGELQRRPYEAFMAATGDHMNESAHRALGKLQRLRDSRCPSARIE